MYNFKCGDGFREWFLKIYLFKLYDIEPRIAMIYYENMVA